MATFFVSIFANLASNTSLHDAPSPDFYHLQNRNSQREIAKNQRFMKYEMQNSNMRES